MPFTDHKLETFTKKISDLPDEPKLLPNELKAYFDSSPEELRQAHNDLCESLDQIQASAVHFTMTAGVPEENVQDAIVNVQAQLKNAIDGSIPSGSIDGDKLAQDVRDRFSAIESAATTEASTRASADSNLQSQINTHTGQIAALTASKCELYFGSYTGNGDESQYISLGFAPKAVICANDSGMISRMNYPEGAIALPGTEGGLVIEGNGFRVYYSSNSYWNNTSNTTYHFIAVK